MMRRLNSFPKAILDRIYWTDSDGSTVELREFLNVNFYNKTNSVIKITPNQVRQIIDLEPGESTFINLTEIKRIS